MNAIDLINAALAMPHTHAVVTTYADGTERRFTTRSLASATTHADFCERPKIGRKLISRGDDLGHKAGDIVTVVSVEVVEI